MGYSLKDSYETYQGASNDNSTAEMKEDTTTVAGSTPEAEEQEQETTIEDEYADLTDEELVDRWEWAAQNGWDTHKEAAAEEMADRNISPKYGEYEEMSREEITNHKRFRKRWLDE